MFIRVVRSGEDASTVIAAGQALARRLDQEGSLLRHGPDPGWTAWSPSDQRWAEWDEPIPDWLMWDGGPARVYLNIEPARQLAHVRVRPNLIFQIDRIDTLPEGLPVNNDGARRIARNGSSVAGWHLAARPVLPDDVLEMLRYDEDPGTVAAAEAGEEIRKVHASWDTPPEH